MTFTFFMAFVLPVILIAIILAASVISFVFFFVDLTEASLLSEVVKLTIGIACIVLVVFLVSNTHIKQYYSTRYNLPKMADRFYMHYENTEGDEYIEKYSFFMWEHWIYHVKPENNPNNKDNLEEEEYPEFTIAVSENEGGN